MSKLFGLPGSDDASNRRFAENLMKYKGWRAVAYKGKGVFDVDYHFEGRVGQDYAFPGDARFGPHHPVHHHPPAQ